MISLFSILPSYQFARYQAAADTGGGEGKEEIRVGFTQWGGSDSNHTRHSISLSQNYGARY